MQNPRFTVVHSTDYLPHAIIEVTTKIIRANFADKLTAELTCSFLNSLWNAPLEAARRANDLCPNCGKKGHSVKELCHYWALS